MLSVLSAAEQLKQLIGTSNLIFNVITFSCISIVFFQMWRQHNMCNSVHIVQLHNKSMNRKGLKITVIEIACGLQEHKVLLLWNFAEFAKYTVQTFRKDKTHLPCPSISKSIVVELRHISYSSCRLHIEVSGTIVVKGLGHKVAVKCFVSLGKCQIAVIRYVFHHACVCMNDNYLP